MEVVRDQAWKQFDQITRDSAFTGERIKQQRAGALKPGGRCKLTLFEQVNGRGRPHPRMRVSLPPAQDPSPPDSLYDAPSQAPSTVEAFEEHLRTALDKVDSLLGVEDLDEEDAPVGSEHYWRNSIRVQRLARFFDAAKAQLTSWLASGALPRSSGAACRYAMRDFEAGMYAGLINFDDADTGTYHSFGKDAPFVHYLEQLLETLPQEGSEAFSLLRDGQQESVRRQIEHARAHLDYLMRHKYAHDGITETDIERSLGGLLIDRKTRYIVSETPASAGGLVPAYELLRIAPDFEHPNAGAWVYRDGDTLKLQEGEEVQVPEDQLRSRPVATDQLTFRRAPKHPQLREGVRLDWDNNGFVKAGQVGWVSWAGHCDIKAIMEMLGLCFVKEPKPDQPFLEEYRSDTGKTVRYSRELIIEMIASVMELGSSYNRVDGTGRVTRGVHSFGGSRNDSRPDRLQFEGLGRGRHFRWPLSTRKETFVVTKLQLGEESVVVNEAFQRYLPDTQALEFEPNPRFLKTVEGDYNLIDVTGSVITAAVKIDGFDGTSGYPKQTTKQLTVDLREEPEEKRQFLGTHMKDAAARELYEIYLDTEANRIDAVVMRFEKNSDGKWEGKEQPDQLVKIPLARRSNVTLSREMKSDDPALLEALVRVGVRQAQNICADTDMAAEVWNGVVTRIDSERIAVNKEARVEHWKVSIKARFGSAEFQYLLRLDENGSSKEYCPIPGAKSPDFLWQDFPDVGSKGLHGRDWIVNTKMVDRGIVEVKHSSSVPGGVYVYDDQIKNVFEMLWAALSGNRYTIVHHNKRYSFSTREPWRESVRLVDAARDKLTFK